MSSSGSTNSSGRSVGSSCACSLISCVKNGSGTPAQLEQATETVGEPRQGGVVWARDERIEVRSRPAAVHDPARSYGVRGNPARDSSGAASEAVEMGASSGRTYERTLAKGPVVITLVSPPAADSLHGRASVRLGNPETVARAWPDWLLRSGLIAVGDFHSHPITGGTPSRPDREAWARQVKRSGGLEWVGVVVTRGEGGFGWSGPKLTAWVTSPDGRGGYVCEPAAVVHP
jgi:hypothetical protein